MIEYIPTENKFEELEIPKVTGYQKQFSIAPPRGDISENTPAIPSEPEVEETVEEVVEEPQIESPSEWSDIKSIIKKNEGFVGTAKSLFGEPSPTVGYGFFDRLPDGRKIMAGMRLSEEEADKQLDIAINKLSKQINASLSRYDLQNKVSNEQFNILTDLGYHGGIGLVNKLLKDSEGSISKIGTLLSKYATTAKYGDTSISNGLKNRALRRVQGWNKYTLKGKEGMKIPITKSGSKIYIKPQNRGKFTRLKQRTGKSATWFKEHGTPAQKKMATFALNAKKWKHQEGGSLLKTVPLTENYFRGYPYKSGKYSAAELLSNTGIPRIPADDYILNAPVNLDDYKDKQEYMESGFNSNAYNKYSKATGRFQITPIAHREYTNRTGKTGDLNDPAYNEQVRDWYMNEYLPNTKVVKEGNAYPMVQAAKILAAYNYGPGALNKKLVALQKNGIDTTSSLEWVNHLNPETSNYIKFILMGEDVGRKTNEEFERLKRK